MVCYLALLLLYHPWILGLRRGLLFGFVVVVVPSLDTWIAPWFVIWPCCCCTILGYLDYAVVCYLALLLLLYHPWILGLHHCLLFGLVVVVPSLDNLQNTESLLSMNNIDICLTTA